MTMPNNSCIVESRVCGWGLWVGPVGGAVGVVNNVLSFC